MDSRLLLSRGNTYASSFVDKSSEDATSVLNISIRRWLNPGEIFIQIHFSIYKHSSKKQHFLYVIFLRISQIRNSTTN